MHQIWGESSAHPKYKKSSDILQHWQTRAASSRASLSDQAKNRTHWPLWKLGRGVQMCLRNVQVYITIERSVYISWQATMRFDRCIYIALYYKLFISKALRYGPCVTMGSHSFTCHPHTNHTCLYSPASRRHCPLAGTHCAYPRRDSQAELIRGIEPGHGHPSQY